MSLSLKLRSFKILCMCIDSSLTWIRNGQISPITLPSHVRKEIPLRKMQSWLYNYLATIIYVTISWFIYEIHMRCPSAIRQPLSPHGCHNFQVPNQPMTQHMLNALLKGVIILLFFWDHWRQDLTWRLSCVLVINWSWIWI